MAPCGVLMGTDLVCYQHVGWQSGLLFATYRKWAVQVRISLITEQHAYLANIDLNTAFLCRAMSTTTRKARHEKQRTNYLEGQGRHPYILRPALKRTLAEESSSNASSDVCAQYRPILSRYADIFNAMVHQGTALKKRKCTNSNPKHTDSIPYRNVKQQNDWLQSNVSDTMGNYLYYCACICAALGISKRRLAHSIL